MLSLLTRKMETNHDRAYDTPGSETPSLALSTFAALAPLRDSQALAHATHAGPSLRELLTNRLTG